jgi:hypothetical protein
MFSPDVLTVGAVALVVAGLVALRVFRPKLHANYTPYAERWSRGVPAPTMARVWPREPLPDDPALTYTGDPDLQVESFDPEHARRRGGLVRYLAAVIVVIWYAAVLTGHAHIPAPWWIPVLVIAWNVIAIGFRRRRAAA